jgi:DNA invertase Pin-like site-specific DNA recombinase
LPLFARFPEVFRVPKAVGYCRVSTEGQAVEGVSLQAQQARIERHCRDHELELDPADVFIGAGISGKRADNRPGLKKAVNLVCARATVLVVYSLSRLARSAIDAEKINDRLEKSGANLVSLSEAIDTTTATGRFFFRIVAAMAQLEREIIAERTLTGHAIAIRADLAPSVVNRFLKGQRSLSLDSFERICHALGLSLVEDRRRRGSL